uniref:PulJ/GspJ family protein n=1 Tax=Thaumasiovibrio occultus TaxID=1891184 RepID=UPI000B3523BA|nr:prepilin-type N-terminal cleavage/methylation domain-containing protein [Thaumasiovibrio occultus]
MNRLLRGFTLIEMVITLMVFAVISLAITGFISQGAQGYVATVERERLQGKARLVLARIEQEVRHAVPNSVSVSGNCLQFYPIFLSGFYTSKTPSQVAVIPRHGDEALWKDRDRVYGTQVAIGLGTPQQFADAPQVLGAASGSQAPFTLPINKYPDSRSSTERVYLFSEPVRFCHSSDGTLRRAVGDNAVEISPILSDGIADLTFRAEGAGLNSNGLLHVDLNLYESRTDENARFTHSIKVLNVQ